MRLPRFSAAAMTCLLLAGGVTAFATGAQASAAPKQTNPPPSGNVITASSYCYWFPGQFGHSSNCDRQDPDVLGPHCNSDAWTVLSQELLGDFTHTPSGKYVLLRYSLSCALSGLKLSMFPAPRATVRAARSGSTGTRTARRSPRHLYSVPNTTRYGRR